ncbi:MAG: hypothetical protein ACRD2D_07455, partial [Terriglobales bacterium]
MHRPLALALLTGMLAAAAAAQPPPTVAQVVQRAVAHERQFPLVLAGFRPRVETYIQALGRDRDRQLRPDSDAYYLGILDLSHGWQDTLFTGANQGPLAHAFDPVGFAGMVTPDRSRFDPQHYN